jgi:hypothetical protein
MSLSFSLHCQGKRKEQKELHLPCRRSGLAYAFGVSFLISRRDAESAEFFLKRLGLSKVQCRQAIEAIKLDPQLPNNFHGRIMSNGDYAKP